ncbi:MAG: UMP kinase [Spirochaetales bacterium]|nr:UMP kinase [Spirochaetales bacterium]
MRSTTVVSLGGSLIASDKGDARFLKSFYSILKRRLDADASRRFILVTGGGAIARENQRKYTYVRGSDEARPDSQDWIGIAATKNNAELIRHIFEDYCKAEVLSDPEKLDDFEGQVLTASGWKPGRSTDYVAVALASRIKADKVINLTNIARVYSDDPRTNPAARALDEISWKDYRSIVGDEWSPGKNTPFDPVASKLAQKKGITVLIVKGSDQEADLKNLESALDGDRFFGTTIHP